MRLTLPHSGRGMEREESTQIPGSSTEEGCGDGGLVAVWHGCDELDLNYLSPEK